MAKRRFVLSVLVGSLAPLVLGKTLILPLQVDSQNHASYQWLGKAFSHYLQSGFELNGVEACSEEVVQVILNRNRIRFPYSITKATALALARQAQAQAVLWGKILYNQQDGSQLTVKTSLLLLSPQEQRHLPLIKGNFKDLFRVQEEVLKQVLTRSGAGEPVQLPPLNLPPADYEKYVKSLLLNDIEKRRELLQPLAEAQTRSDFVNLEVAKLWLQKGDGGQAETALLRISDHPLFRNRTRFLLALSLVLKGETDAALDRFLQLQKENVYPLETHNNLGVLFMQKNNTADAETCLRYALYLDKDPDIYANYIHLLCTAGRTGQAVGELNQALLLFPEDERLQRLFVRCLLLQEDKEALAQVFRNYLLQGVWPEEEFRFKPQLKNPLLPRTPLPAAPDYKAVYVEARSLFLENDLSGAQVKVEETMELNPFFADSHHLSALLSLQQKNPSRAELYALSALFLKPSAENYLLLVKVYQSVGRADRAQSTARRALEKFPDNKELRDIVK